jgi:hypothetical protein
VFSAVAAFAAFSLLFPCEILIVAPILAELAPDVGTKDDESTSDYATRMAKA